MKSKQIIVISCMFLMQSFQNWMILSFLYSHSSLSFWSNYPNCSKLEHKENLANLKAIFFILFYVYKITKNKNWDSVKHYKKSTTIQNCWMKVHWDHKRFWEKRNYKLIEKLIISELFRSFFFWRFWFYMEPRRNCKSWRFTKELKYRLWCVVEVVFFVMWWIIYFVIFGFFVVYNFTFYFFWGISWDVLIFSWICWVELAVVFC